jgi:hypothetical protein
MMHRERCETLSSIKGAASMFGKQGLSVPVHLITYVEVAFVGSFHSRACALPSTVFFRTSIYML